MPKNDQPNRPETYLTPSERATLNRILGFPEEYPQKFIAWIDDHLKVNVPQFPITQIKGFNDYATTVQQFLLGEGPSWPFIGAKGDLIVGYAPKTVTVLPVEVTDGWVLTIDSAEPSGLKWAVSSASATGARELAVVFSAPSQAVSANTAMSIGITTLLDGIGAVSEVAAFVTTVGSSDTVVTIGSGISDDPITIQSGDNWDDGTATLNDPSVAIQDIIPITVTSAGTGAKGLTVIVTFG